MLISAAAAAGPIISGFGLGLPPPCRLFARSCSFYTWYVYVVVAGAHYAIQWTNDVEPHQTKHAIAFLTWFWCLHAGGRWVVGYSTDILDASPQATKSA
jgi:hypothetical protein